MILVIKMFKQKKKITLVLIKLSFKKNCSKFKKIIKKFLSCTETKGNKIN